MQSATGLGEKLMARRYRYAFAKKREASKGKWSVGLAAASLVLFIAAVVRNRAFCHAAFCIWLYTGAFQLFGRKPETQDEHGRVYFERSDPGYLAGTFFIGGITDG